MCGLYAAWRLVQSGCSVTVLEMQDDIGGLATSADRNGVHYDLGVKHLHAHDQEIFADLQRLMGDQLIPVPLDAKIRFGDKFHRYPLKLTDLLLGIPPWRIAWLFGGLAWQQIRNQVTTNQARNAEHALIHLYGRPLYQYFFRDFTQRYWGIPPHELSAEFVRRKMPRLGAVDLIKQVFALFGAKRTFQSHVENALAEETLYYSAGGAIAIPRQMARAVEQGGSKIVVEATVSRIEVQSNRIECVQFTHAGNSETITCDEVISTIPVTSLANALAGDIDAAQLATAASQLEFRPIVVYGLLVRKPTVLNALYVYYRDRIFHRIAEPTRSGLSAPKDHSVLLVELTCQENDAVWNNSTSAIERVFDDLERESLVSRQDVLEVHHMRSPFGYPIFRQGFEQPLKAITRTVESIENLQSVGRQGGFCYPNMHQTMRQGRDAADLIIKKMPAAE